MTQVIMDGKSLNTKMLSPSLTDTNAASKISGYSDARNAINSLKTKEALYNFCKPRIQTYTLILASSIETMISIQSRIEKISQFSDYARSARAELLSSGNNSLISTLGSLIDSIDGAKSKIDEYIAKLTESQTKMTEYVDNAVLRLYLLSSESAKVRNAATKKPLSSENTIMASMAGCAILAREIYAFDFDLFEEAKNFNKISMAINANLDAVVSIAVKALDEDDRFRGAKSFRNRNASLLSKGQLSEDQFNTTTKLLNSTLAVLWLNSEKTPIRDSLRHFLNNMAENSPDLLTIPTNLTDSNSAKNILDSISIKRGNLLHKLYYGKITDNTAISPDDVSVISAFSGGKINESDVKDEMLKTARPPSAAGGVPRSESDVPPPPNIKHDNIFVDPLKARGANISKNLFLREAEKKKTEEALDKSLADLKNAEDQAAAIKAVEEKNRALEAQVRELELTKKKSGVVGVISQARDRVSGKEVVPVLPETKGEDKPEPEDVLIVEDTKIGEDWSNGDPNADPAPSPSNAKPEKTGIEKYLNTKNLLIAAAIVGTIALIASSSDSEKKSEVK
jgi:hypothetical protein